MGSRVGGRVDGWLGGWSEDLRVMLNSTQDQIKLKLKFELSLAIHNSHCWPATVCLLVKTGKLIRYSLES